MKMNPAVAGRADHLKLNEVSQLNSANQIRIHLKKAGSKSSTRYPLLEIIQSNFLREKKKKKKNNRSREEGKKKGNALSTRHPSTCISPGRDKRRTHRSLHNLRAGAISKCPVSSHTRASSWLLLDVHLVR